MKLTIVLGESSLLQGGTYLQGLVTLIVALISSANSQDCGFTKLFVPTLGNKTHFFLQQGVAESLREQQQITINNYLTDNPFTVNVTSVTFKFSGHEKYVHENFTIDTLNIGFVSLNASAELRNFIIEQPNRTLQRKLTFNCTTGATVDATVEIPVHENKEPPAFMTLIPVTQAVDIEVQLPWPSNTPIRTGKTIFVRDSDENRGNAELQVVANNTIVSVRAEYLWAENPGFLYKLNLFLRSSPEPLPGQYIIDLSATDNKWMRSVLVNLKLTE